jgi:GNAT superfamily N-acetyltransferase
VPRSGLTVRPATVADLPGMVELQAEMREALGRRIPRSGEPTRSAEDHLLAALADPDARVVVAVDGDLGIVGMASLHTATPTLLIESRVVHAGLVHVRRSARSNGVGRLLMVAAAAFAEETGADHVSVDVYPQHRESQRFYVRMGFAPLVVRRIAPLSLLKRRLGSTTLGPSVPVVGEAVGTAGRRGVRARLETARAVSVARRRVG